MSGTERRKVRIWDLPTRAFHWLIVLVVPLQWWTHRTDRMDLHLVIGQITLGLILFRLLWGLFGSETARFSNFLKGPGAVLSYLSGRAAHVLGHNPLGGWNVAVLLLLLAVQVSLGLFASDEDALYLGPLSHLVSYDTARAIAELHETLFKIMLGFIALHVLAIAWYAAVRRKNLVTPMLTGQSEVEPGVSGIAPPTLWRFLVVAALSAALTWFILTRI